MLPITLALGEYEYHKEWILTKKVSEKNKRFKSKTRCQKKKKTSF